MGFIGFMGFVGFMGFIGYVCTEVQALALHLPWAFAFFDACRDRARCSTPTAASGAPEAATIPQNCSERLRSAVIRDIPYGYHFAVLPASMSASSCSSCLRRWVPCRYRETF